MLSDAMGLLNDHNHTRSFIVEAVNAEKRLWTLIHSKGLLHTDVQDLYHKTRSSYEKIILSDHELAELQDIEYSLWKLHYKHIDEFRNKIRQSSTDAENKSSMMPQNESSVQHSSVSLLEGFRSFLSEATEFYQDLITKIRRAYGLPEDLLFFKDGNFTSSMEPAKLHKCQFSCHRCLVYLGDLARYRELYGNSGIEKHNWSIAATHYINASMIWADSGNPQNQLAVLATYLGDEFLTLYHFIRSLAVKDPFPDAWDNLNLLFEKNRSSHLHSISTEISFDFNEPCERSTMQTKAQFSYVFSTSNIRETTEDVVHSVDTSLWSLIVRMMSSFYLKSSLEDFSCTFASTIRELETLLSLDDVRLKTALESYQHMDASRTGPFRALQLVSILIFTIHTLSESPKQQMPKNLKDMQQPVLIQLVLASTFVCMGRIVHRCAMANPLDRSPLLPAVLVFVEWLTVMLDVAEAYEVDEKYANTMGYFFDAFVDLLNQFDDKGGEIESLDCTALWEDHELHGFTPIHHAHEPLDFSVNQGSRFGDSCECQIRIHRILLAAMKVVNRSNRSLKWIFYDQIGKRFCTVESKEPPDRNQSVAVESGFDPKVRDLLPSVLKNVPPIHRTNNESEVEVNETHQSNLDVHGNNIAVEEEEVILFKPITRYNSVPLCIPEATSETLPSGECLRRVSSSLCSQNQDGRNPSIFHSNITSSSCNKMFLQNTTLAEDSVKYPFRETCISAGPPSLNAWVLNREHISIPGKTGTNGTAKYGSGCTEDIASTYLNSLSIGGTTVGPQDPQVNFPVSASHCLHGLLSEGNSVDSPGYASATIHHTASRYSAPVPSAPLLPDNATWFHGDSSNYAGCKDSYSIPNFLSGSQVNCYSNWIGTQASSLDPGVPECTNGYTPLVGRTDSGRMDSNPWLRHYWDKYNLDRANSNIKPNHFYTPTNLGNFHDHDVNRLDPYDRWTNAVSASPRKYLEEQPLHPGFSLVYGADDKLRDKLAHGYQRPSPFGYGTVVDLASEQELLLQYLKEKEWRLHGSPN